MNRILLSIIITIPVFLYAKTYTGVGIGENQMHATSMAYNMLVSQVQTKVDSEHESRAYSNSNGYYRQDVKQHSFVTTDKTIENTEVVSVEFIDGKYKVTVQYDDSTLYEKILKTFYGKKIIKANKESKNFIYQTKMAQKIKNVLGVMPDMRFVETQTGLGLFVNDKLFKIDNTIKIGDLFGMTYNNNFDYKATLKRFVMSAYLDRILTVDPKFVGQYATVFTINENGEVSVDRKNVKITKTVMAFDRPVRQYVVNSTNKQAKYYSVVVITDHPTVLSNYTENTKYHKNTTIKDKASITDVILLIDSYKNYALDIYNVRQHTGSI